MKSLLPIMVAGLSTVLVPSVALASAESSVSVRRARGADGDTPVITVNTDYGASISFIETDEVIAKAWLGQFDAVEVGFDRALGQAKVMFLKQSTVAKNLDGTSLTLITKNPQTQTQVYSFLIKFKSGKPDQSVWVIRPEPIEQRARVATLQPSNIRQSQRTVPQGNSDRQNVLPDADLGEARVTKAKSQKKLAKEQKRRDKKQRAQQKDPVKRETVQPENNQEKDRRSSPTLSETKTLLRTTKSQPRTALETSIQTDVKPKSSDSSTPNGQSAKPSIASSRSASKGSVPSHEQKISVNRRSQGNDVLLNKHQQANALVRGLVEANRRGQITLESSMRARVNSVVLSLRRGQEIKAAAKSARVSWSVIDQLLKWGNYDVSLL